MQAAKRPTTSPRKSLQSTQVAPPPPPPLLTPPVATMATAAAVDQSASTYVTAPPLT